MFNQDKLMQEWIEATVKLNFNQLILANAHMGEHLHNMMQHHLLKQLDKETQDPVKH